MPRLALVALLLVVPALAGCSDVPPPREVAHTALLDVAMAERPSPEPDDRLVAVATVEGRDDLTRGNGLSSAWTFIFGSESAGRLACVLVRADGAPLERRNYATPEDDALGAPIEDAISSAAAVAAARKDPAFGLAAVRAERFVETLAANATGPFWLVAAATPGGNVTAIELDARDGSVRRATYFPSEAARAARCP